MQMMDTKASKKKFCYSLVYILLSPSSAVCHFCLARITFLSLKFCLVLEPRLLSLSDKGHWPLSLPCPTEQTSVRALGLEDGSHQVVKASSHQFGGRGESPSKRLRQS